jgi:integrase
LTELHLIGVGYSAINTAKSALSAVFSTDSAQTFGSHPFLIRFMKGIYEQKPPRPKYEHIWDVSILLKYFKEQKQNSFLSLPDLTRKLCALMLLATAQRIQTVHLIRVHCIHMEKNKCEIEIVDKIKQSKPGSRGVVLKFDKFFEDEKLCVITALEEYLLRTAKLRCHTDKLFLCYSKPHGAASKDTVARWMRTVLSKAGIDNFAPHSFRSAASSAMISSGMSVDQVIKTAGWTRASTFQRFYNRAVVGKTEHKIQSNSILRYFNKQNQ